jgi:hypothetical protein
LWRWESGELAAARPLRVDSRRILLATDFVIVAAEATTGRIVWRYGQTPAQVSAPGSDPEDFPRFRWFGWSEAALVAVRDDGRRSRSSAPTGGCAGRGPGPIGQPARWQWGIGA